jgi:hypothetical protein
MCILIWGCFQTLRVAKFVSFIFWCCCTQNCLIRRLFLGTFDVISNEFAMSVCNISMIISSINIGIHLKTVVSVIVFENSVHYYCCQSILLCFWIKQFYLRELIMIHTRKKITHCLSHTLSHPHTHTHTLTLTLSSCFGLLRLIRDRGLSRVGRNSPPTFLHLDHALPPCRIHDNFESFLFEWFSSVKLHTGTLISLLSNK